MGCPRYVVLRSLFLALTVTSGVFADRRVESLHGDWQFQVEGAGDQWKPVSLPASFEEHEGVAFDGVGIYRKQITRTAIPEGMRAILHFQAAATLAEVWLDDTHLGSHLGGWTPFRFDVTELMRSKCRGFPRALRAGGRDGGPQFARLPADCLPSLRRPLAGRPVADRTGLLDRRPAIARRRRPGVGEHPSGVPRGRHSERARPGCRRAISAARRSGMVTWCDGSGEAGSRRGVGFRTQGWR